MTEYERGRLDGLQQAAEAARQFRQTHAESPQEELAASLISSRIIELVNKQHGEMREQETEQ
jgi:hypothetical protein